MSSSSERVTVGIRTYELIHSTVNHSVAIRRALDAKRAAKRREARWRVFRRGRLRASAPLTATWTVAGGSNADGTCTYTTTSAHSSRRVFLGSASSEEYNVDGCRRATCFGFPRPPLSFLRTREPLASQRGGGAASTLSLGTSVGAFSRMRASRALRRSRTTGVQRRSRARVHATVQAGRTQRSARRRTVRGKGDLHWDRRCSAAGQFRIAIAWCTSRRGS